MDNWVIKRSNIQDDPDATKWLVVTGKLVLEVYADTQAHARLDVENYLASQRHGDMTGTEAVLAMIAKRRRLKH